VRNFRISKALSSVLGIFPWLYLLLALLFAVTRSEFIICRFDPFVGIFRLGGDAGLIIFGALLLVAAVFTGRPFCRFICPYGVLLGLIARFSIWKVRLTGKTCINCQLCHNACPVDAIRPPFGNPVSEHRSAGVRRLLIYFVVLPLLMAAGALLMSHAADLLSRMHRDVRLYDQVMAHEADPQDVLSLELEAFYGQGGSVEELTGRFEAIQADYSFYAPIAGALMGLAIGLTLIGLSLKRARIQYDIDHGSCVACGRCFHYCPQNQKTEMLNS
jgi:NAD-dependent dihydropyrimidine dehydrogenase PreA subunit